MTNHTERLRNAGLMVDHFRNELVTAREELDTLRAAQPGTVADLTERLVAASSEWDDLTGDDEGPTSRPYLEHLARAVASWRPGAEPAGCASISERWGHLACENKTDEHPGLCVAWHAESGKPKRWDRKGGAR